MKRKAYAAIVLLPGEREVSARKACELEFIDDQVRVLPRNFKTYEANKGGEAIVKFFAHETGPEWILVIRADGVVMSL